MPLSPRLDFRHWSEVDSITNRTPYTDPYVTVVWEGGGAILPLSDRNARSTARWIRCIICAADHQPPEICFETRVRWSQDD